MAVALKRTRKEINFQNLLDGVDVQAERKEGGQRRGKAPQNLLPYNVRKKTFLSHSNFM